MKRKDDGIDVEGRLPGFFLYPADLERELQPLPIGAQGVWIRMLLRMHWAPRRGYLEHPTGKPFTEEDISRMVGQPKSSISKMLYEMEHRYGTFSRDENGVIFNRRMVRDTDISLKRKAAGKQGGNPVLVGSLDKQNSDLDNQDPNQKSIRGYTRARTSSSTASSSSAEAKTAPYPHGEFPEVGRAVREKFPEASDVVIMQITMAVGQKCAGANGKLKGDPTDVLMAEAVRHCAKAWPAQNSPHGYTKTVPQCVVTWLTQGRTKSAGGKKVTYDEIFN